MSRARVTSVAHATPFNRFGSLATNWLGSRLTRSRQTTDDTSNQRLFCQQRGTLRGLLRADRENDCTFHARAQYPYTAKLSRYPHVLFCRSAILAVVCL